jgi:CRP/FNR family transcriptional regulator
MTTKPSTMRFDTEHMRQLRSACSACSLRELCLPAGLDLQELNAVDNLIKRRRTVARSEVLFRNNSALQSLYAIRAGCMKTSVLHEDGREQVAGFHMAGDLMGLDAIGGGHHVCDAVALDDSEVCEIPLDMLEQLSREIPSLQQHFHRILSREIVRDHGMMLLLGSMRADERLAVFLLNLSQRHAARGYSPVDFVLRMTRADIGSYLGLKLETVSRALSRMQVLDLIEVRNRHLRIIDMDGLKSIANRCAATLDIDPLRAGHCRQA